MRSVARIIMEEYLKQPQPTPKHRIGFKDFDYRNITPINMIWETPKEKAERFHKMFPFKKKSNNHEHQNIDLTHNPGELHDEIVRLLAAGNNYRQAANKLGISYYRLYRYCKRRGM